MDKTLVNNQEEYMNIFHATDMSLDEIENILGIEFAFVDGKFRSNWMNDASIDEDQDLDLNNFKKHEDAVFPESYPCLVVHWIENNFDRFGKVNFRMIEFVYPSDFK